jgi:hypothetical protein
VRRTTTEDDGYIIIMLRHANDLDGRKGGMDGTGSQIKDKRRFGEFGDHLKSSASFRCRSLHCNAFVQIVMLNNDMFHL